MINVYRFIRNCVNVLVSGSSIILPESPKFQSNNRRNSFTSSSSDTGTLLPTSSTVDLTKLDRGYSAIDLTELNRGLEKATGDSSESKNFTEALHTHPRDEKYEFTEPCTESSHNECPVVVLAVYDPGDHFVASRYLTDAPVVTSAAARQDTKVDSGVWSAAKIMKIEFNG